MSPARPSGQNRSGREGEEPGLRAANGRASGYERSNSEDPKQHADQRFSGVLDSLSISPEPVGVMAGARRLS
jgi:hypothetical protein